MVSCLLLRWLRSFHVVFFFPSSVSVYLTVFAATAGDGGLMTTMMPFISVVKHTV